MLKRLLAIVLSGVMVTALLGGCSKDTQSQESTGDTTINEESSNKEETTDVQTSDEPVTLNIFCAYASEEPHGQYVYEYANNYMAQYPNVKIEITAISSNDIYTKLAAMATSPDDLPTLFFTSADQAPTLYDLGMTEDLNKWLSQEEKEEFANGVVDACTLDDTMAFYPIDVQPSAIIYRQDWFEENNLEIPKTWDEFLKCAQALTADTNNDGEIDRWGFSMVGANNSSGQSRFMSYLWSNGFDLISKDADGTWKNDLNQSGFLDAFSFWTDLNNKHQVVPSGITEVDYATAANYFAMGYTGMMLSGSNAIGVAYSNNPELKGKIASFKIPGDAPGTMLNAEGYAVCSKASDSEKKAAVEFLKYFNLHDKNQMFWQSSGKIPSTKEGQSASYISGPDYAGYLDTIANGCIPTVNFAGLSGLKTILGDGYSSVFSGEKSNEEAIEKMSSDLDTLLEDYN